MRGHRLQSLRTVLPEMEETETMAGPRVLHLLRVLLLPLRGEGGGGVVVIVIHVPHGLRLHAVVAAGGNAGWDRDCEPV